MDAPPGAGRPVRGEKMAKPVQLSNGRTWKTQSAALEHLTSRPSMIASIMTISWHRLGRLGAHHARPGGAAKPKELCSNDNIKSVIKRMIPENGNDKVHISTILRCDVMDCHRS